MMAMMLMMVMMTMVMMVMIDIDDDNDGGNATNYMKIHRDKINNKPLYIIITATLIYVHCLRAVLYVYHSLKACGIVIIHNLG